MKTAKLLLSALVTSIGLTGLVGEALALPLGPGKYQITLDCNGRNSNPTWADSESPVYVGIGWIYKSGDVSYSAKTELTQLSMKDVCDAGETKTYTQTPAFVAGKSATAERGLPGRIMLRWATVPKLPLS